jgi:hypothetical protein
VGRLKGAGENQLASGRLWFSRFGQRGGDESVTDNGVSNGVETKSLWRWAWPIANHLRFSRPSASNPTLHP